MNRSRPAIVVPTKVQSKPTVTGISQQVVLSPTPSVTTCEKNKECKRKKSCPCIPLSYSVRIPGLDQFLPYAITIRTGDSVTWHNEDTDNHTVVSLDSANSVSSPRNINQEVFGTDAVGQPHTFTLKFDSPGLFVYYCRFHSHLDTLSSQPIAPGCGESDAPQVSGNQEDFTCDGCVGAPGVICSVEGNFGTPMTGIIAVLPCSCRDRDD